MKQFFLKINKHVKPFVLAGFITIVSTPLFAKQDQESISSLAIEPSIEFIGTHDMTDMISVKFETAVPVKVDIAIKDEAGNTFFSKAYETSAFSKVFGIVNESADPNATLFLTLHTSDGKEFTYSITKKTTLVKDILVTKS